MEFYSLNLGDSACRSIGIVYFLEVRVGNGCLKNTMLILDKPINFSEAISSEGQLVIKYFHNKFSKVDSIAFQWMSTKLGHFVEIGLDHFCAQRAGVLRIVLGDHV